MTPTPWATAFPRLRAWFVACRKLLPAHEHAFEPTTTHAHAPTGPAPEHTSFIVVVCRCSAIQVFPASNYDLTTPAFKAAFEREMSAKGYFWHEEHTP